MTAYKQHERKNCHATPMYTAIYKTSPDKYLLAVHPVTTNIIAIKKLHSV